jgi:hypothetical protein
MNAFDALAEARIAAAIERGELENLPGSGRPLVLDDDRAVPEELRAAYRVLRNAGYVPREVELRREIATAERLVTLAVADGAERARAQKRLALLRLRLAERGRGRLDPRYEARIRARLD